MLSVGGRRDHGRARLILWTLEALATMMLRTINRRSLCTTNVVALIDEAPSPNGAVAS